MPTRTLRSESGGPSWELVLGRPAKRLRAFVLDYEGYAESASPSGILRQQVPTTRVPMIVNFGAPWRIADTGDETGRSELRDSFVAGLADNSAFVAAAGPASCLQIDFTPIGAHVFLGIPMHELSNRVVDLADVLPSGAHNLADRLAAAGSWDARFALLDDVLGARLAEATRPSPEIVWAWRALQRTNGRVRIGTLTERLGHSRRHLIARFREQIGLPPKTVARIFRFQHAVRLLQGSAQVGLAELAFECGYYDQAHLNRDFREFAGMSPGAFAERLSPGDVVPAG